MSLLWVGRLFFLGRGFGHNGLAAVSLNDDVDTNKELVAHGYSNLLAGLFGTVCVFCSRFVVRFGS